MKKVSLLVLVCMLLSLGLTACDSHTCAFGEGWAYDATNHYHTCTCGAKSGTAAHADANNDGACDVCAIIMSNTHVFDKEWESDATNHWHAALCGHDVIDGKEAHTPNAIGKCSVCGYTVSAPTITSISDALDIAAFTQGSVRNGLLSSTLTVESADSWSGYESYVDYTWYEQAENYLHTFETGDKMHTYYTVGKDDTVFALVVGNGDTYVDEYATIENLGGPRFYGLLGNYDTTYYGAISVIEALYEMASANVNGGFTESIEDGIYTFSFLLEGDGYSVGLYSVAVAFTLDEDAYILENAAIAIAGYMEKNTVMNEETWEEEEITNYTFEEVGENKVYTLNDKAAHSTLNLYEFTQSVDIINEHKPEDVLPQSFKLVDAEGNEIDFEAGITVECGQSFIYFTDVAPSTAIFEIAGIEVTFTDSEGNEIWSSYGGYYNGALNITISNPGEYIATITVGESEYVLPITATYAAVKSIVTEVGDSTGWYMEANSASVYVGNTLSFRGTVNNFAAPAYTAAVIGNNADSATLTREDDGTYTFASETEGVYTIKLTSSVNAEVTAELVITVSAAPTLESMLSGTYEGDSITVTFDTANKIVTATTTVRGELKVDTFTYTVDGDEFTATLVDGGSGWFSEIYFNDSYQLVVIADYWDHYLEKTSDLGAPVAIVGGTNIMAGTPIEATGAFTTTVGAGETVYFVAYYMEGFNNIVISYNGEVDAYHGNPRFSMSIVSGSDIALDMMVNAVNFWFTNTSDAAVEVDFSVVYNTVAIG